MSEITKLYENAGVEKEVIKGCYDYYSKLGIDIWKENDCSGKNCDTCKKDKSIKRYPPFTAEKQIAILMFILNKFGDIGFQKMCSIRGNDESTRKDFIKCLCDYCEHETFDSRPVDFYYQNSAFGDNLEESLVGLINTLWQSLTPEEKQQVRGILE